jgi:hypothetical protein
LVEGGKVVSTYNDVEVRLNQNVEISFSASLQTVVVMKWREVNGNKIDIVELS